MFVMFCYVCFVLITNLTKTIDGLKLEQYREMFEKSKKNTVERLEVERDSITDKTFSDFCKTAR